MQNKSEPNKSKSLTAVVLEKLFDQTKKIIKNTLTYLTIFSLVFSSALINTANAVDLDPDNGRTVTAADRLGDSTNAALQDGDNYTLDEAGLTIDANGGAFSFTNLVITNDNATRVLTITD